MKISIILVLAGLAILLCYCLGWLNAFGGTGLTVGLVLIGTGLIVGINKLNDMSSKRQ